MSLSPQAICIWLISLASIAGVLFRPRRSPEWLWAIGGAVLLVSAALIPWTKALSAVADGISVYFFLIGMMLLSELAREEGLFDWLAEEASARAGSSNFRLFALIYLAGIFTTVFLSLDATAVVLTPAVLAAARRAGAKPTAHLFACAMISNAASFVLPISNPANLVLYGGTPPSVFVWLRIFTLPSFAAIAATFLILVFWFRRELSTPVTNSAPVKKSVPSSVQAFAPLISSSPSSTSTSSSSSSLAPPRSAFSSSRLGPGAIAVAAGLFLVVLVMLIYSYLGRDFGIPAFVAATFVAASSCGLQRKSPLRIAQKISWSVIPLVAGLFVIVAALNEAGSRTLLIEFLNWSQSLPPVQQVLTGGFGIGILANILNNLPVGLLVGEAVKNVEVTQSLRKAILLGVDLGPNLSVTGSLATILSLLSIRREGENVRGLDFLKLGLVAMPVAMAVALPAALI